MKKEDLKDYIALARATAIEARQFGVEVLCGIEAEVFPYESELVSMDEILSSYNFDFVLGSLHAQCSSYSTWFDENNIQDDDMRIDTYFRHLKQGVLSRRYDSMSHPDVIRTYGVVENFNPKEHEEVIRGFLHAVIEEDICMEVNTSGLIKGDFEVHPDPLILEWASEIGVKLTIGSDSHSPEFVGQFFDVVQPMLRSKGFTDLYYFRGRQRYRIDMPDGIR